LRRYPDTAPSVRINTGLAFDPENNVTILYGGWDLEGTWNVYHDTWTYSYEDNIWTEMDAGSETSTTTTTTPSPIVPNGSDFEPLMLVLVPSVMVIAAVVVVVILIRRRP
jgi:hypothetical protein